MSAKRKDQVVEGLREMRREANEKSEQVGKAKAVRGKFNELLEELRELASAAEKNASSNGYYLSLDHELDEVKNQVEKVLDRADRAKDEFDASAAGLRAAEIVTEKFAG